MQKSDCGCKESENKTESARKNWRKNCMFKGRRFRLMSGVSSTPDIYILIAMADYFEVSVDELVGRNRKKKK